MEDAKTNEALSVIATAVDETHDGLARLSRNFKTVDHIPAFWWGDFPVWTVDLDPAKLRNWPIQHIAGDVIRLSNARGDCGFDVQFAALKAFAGTLFDDPLTEAEFTLFVDLSSGLSLDQSATQGGLATSTRRKQLQTMFRKLGVLTQAELVSVANGLVRRFAGALEDLHGRHDSGWGGYARFLPNGVRCGTIMGAQGRTVRFLDIGPANGAPVLVLHPMIFPRLDDADVALFHALGLRTIWPIRAGCLTTKGGTSTDWATHHTDTVANIKTVHSAFAQGPVPVVALVSAGAYATGFATAHPDCVARIDFVSTCYSAGKTRTRDAYFGDYLLRSLRQNGRMASVAIQHLAGAAVAPGQLHRTLSRIFKGSTADQDLIEAEWAVDGGGDRVTFAIRQSIASMRHDYVAQIHFDWADARQTPHPKQFWHGVQDRVHNLDDLHALARQVTGQPAIEVPHMGHLTQGAPLRAVFNQLAARYDANTNDLLQTE